MSAPVDVLDVLDPASHLGVKQSAKNDNAGFVDMRDWGAYLGRTKDARAAVAELIKAGSRVTAAFRALGLDNSLINRSRLARECEESMVAFDAALNRVKGGAA